MDERNRGISGPLDDVVGATGCVAGLVVAFLLMNGIGWAAGTFLELGGGGEYMTRLFLVLASIGMAGILGIVVCAKMSPTFPLSSRDFLLIGVLVVAAVLAVVNVATFVTFAQGI